MKWKPAECKRGDMIRVRIGTAYHYGVFVGEDEVIAFGYPPLPAYAEQNTDPEVIATDIDTFCCGKIVEKAVPGLFERRCSPSETISRARSRIGQRGYDLLRNNCEHFAFECVFGIRKSSEEERILSQWSQRPVLDIYLMRTPEYCPEEMLFPELRDRYVRNTGNPELKAQRYSVWKLLLSALDHSMGLKPETLEFRQGRSGKWSCNKAFFSLSHTDKWTVVAVSSAEVGVDAANIPVFLATHAEEKITALRGRIMTEREKTVLDETPQTFLRCWTAKEALFKKGQEKHFSPQSFDTTVCSVITGISETEDPLMISVAGENLNILRWRMLEDSEIIPIAVHEFPAESVKRWNG